MAEQPEKTLLLLADHDALYASREDGPERHIHKEHTAPRPVVS
jgi:hypothetical protein